MPAIRWRFWAKNVAQTLVCISDIIAAPMEESCDPALGVCVCVGSERKTRPHNRSSKPQLIRLNNVSEADFIPVLITNVGSPFVSAHFSRLRNFDEAS